LEIDCAITINLKLTLEEDSAKVTIKEVDLRPAMVKLPIQEVVGQIEPIKERKTYHQIIVEVANDGRSSRTYLARPSVWQKGSIEFPGSG